MLAKQRKSSNQKAAAASKKATRSSKPRKINQQLTISNQSRHIVTGNTANGSTLHQSGKKQKKQLFTSTQAPFSNAMLSDLSSLAHSHIYAPEQFNTSLTMDERQIWYHNKMRPIIQKTVHHLLCQYQLTAPSTTQSPTDAAFETLLNHQLLVPIETREHPYKHANNKQALIKDMIDKVLIPLRIVPHDYHLNYRIGTIPPIEFNGKFKTDTTDLSPLEGLSEDVIAKRDKVTTAADMVAMVLAASGWKDIPDTDDKWANTQYPPAGEDHMSDFSNNYVKLFHPDAKSEFSAPIHKKIREELAIIHHDLTEAASLNIFDTYATNYERRDVTQMFLAHYAGGAFPNIEVYKSFLMQQAAQTMLNEQYLYGSFTSDEFKNIDNMNGLNPDGKTPITIHYHTVAGSMRDFQEQSRKAEEARQQQDLTVFHNVSASMPMSSYPEIEARFRDGAVAPPDPPEHFLMMGVSIDHTISPFSVSDNETPYPHKDEFRAILYSPKHSVSGLRELFLQHFRHDVATYYNFVENGVMQKFKTVLEHDRFTPEELTKLRKVIEVQYAQNQLDEHFKQEMTGVHCARLRKLALEGQLEAETTEDDMELATRSGSEDNGSEGRGSEESEGSGSDVPRRKGRVSDVGTDSSDGLVNIIREGAKSERELAMDIPPKLRNHPDMPTLAELDDSTIVYYHVLGEKYPAFAQKCYQLLIVECNDHAQTLRRDALKTLEDVEANLEKETMKALAKLENETANAPTKEKVMADPKLRA